MLQVGDHAASTGAVSRRCCVWLRGAAFLLLLGCPGWVRAQFQDPTAEELKMTSDPKAPGADAVYLYHEEVDDNEEHVNSKYDRIKVLTEKGKELGTVSIPYEPDTDKLIDFQGRTIHADGTVVAATEKPSNLVEFKTKGFQVNSVVFTLPSVEVGSILEYRLKFRRKDEWKYLPTWNVQGPYFKRKAHYAFKAGQFYHMTYETYVGPDAKVLAGKHDDFTLDITDVPPEPNDDWMPPLNSLRWRVEFFEMNYATAADYWRDLGKIWQAELLDFTNPSNGVKKVVAGIVAPEDSDLKKAQEIYAAVMKLENTDFTREKSKAERKKEKIKDINKVEDVWKQQSGNSSEIALLYVALARAAGLKASPFRVVDRSQAVFDPKYLSGNQLDHYMAVVQVGGKDLFLDPGEKMCPFGSMHWKHALAGGLLLSSEGSAMRTTPALSYLSSEVQRIAYLDVDEAGNVKGSVRFVMSGPEALHWRQLALSNDQNEVKKQFNESMSEYLPEGVQAEFDHFLALDNYETNLIAIVKVSGNIGGATGKRFFLPGLFFESRAKHPFVDQKKREISVDVHFPKLEQDDVTYHLPPGFSVESAPTATSLSWPGHALLKIKSTSDATTVTVTREFGYSYTMIEPTAYGDLHSFYLKVAEADQQPLVLLRAPVTAAKGN